MKHLRPQGRFQVLTSAHPTYQGFDPFFLLLLISPLYQLKIRAAQKTNTGRTPKEKPLRTWHLVNCNWLAKFCAYLFQTNFKPQWFSLICSHARCFDIPPSLTHTDTLHRGSRLLCRSWIIQVTRSPRRQNSRATDIWPCILHTCSRCGPIRALPSKHRSQTLNQKRLAGAAILGRRL